MTRSLRMLAGFGLLMGVLIVLQAAAQHWAGPMIETWRLAPRTAFEPLPALAPDRYDQATMWLARPGLPADPARMLPPGVVHDRRGAAYVFFVHPTTFFGRNHWNAPLDHADSRMRAALAVRSMASVFNDEAGIYAPRYRQAAMGTFVVDRPASRQALALAEGDVRSAFAAFVRSIPPRAPIVLAGDGQGALIVVHLLRDAVRGTPVAPRVIAVYLAGWPISPAHDVPITGLRACTRPDQSGCIMAWMTFAEPADPHPIMTMAAHYPALDGRHADDTPLCTNPLTSGSGPIAPATANRGSLAIGDERRAGALVLPSVGARCDRATGLLLVSGPPHLGDHVLPGNNYAMYDFALFWRNLRADVARREATWQQEHRPS